jgi:hypothetical protein
MKIFFYWRVKLQKKNQFNKRTKKKRTIKRMRTTLKKAIYKKLEFNNVIENK